MACRVVAVLCGLWIGGASVAHGQTPEITIDALEGQLGLERQMTAPKLRAGVVFSGTTTHVADGVQVSVTLGGTPIGTPAVSGDTWSLTVDDGLSGIVGAVDVTGVSDGYHSLAVSVTTTGGEGNSSTFVALFKTPQLTYFGAEFPSDDGPNIAEMSGEAFGFDIGHVLNYSLTDEQSSQVTGTTSVRGGEGIYWGVKDDPTSLSDGVITVVVSGTDSLGNYAEATDSFILDTMASGTVSWTGPRAYFSRERSLSSYRFEGTTEGVEPGQRLDLTLSGPSGIEVRGETYLDSLGNWSIAGDQFAQIAKKNEFFQSGERSHGTKNVDICVLMNPSDLGAYPYRGDFLAVYQARGAGGKQDVFFQKVSEAGVLIGSPVAVTNSAGEHDEVPTVGALNDGGWVIAWNRAQDAVWRRFDAAGNPQGAGPELVDGTLATRPHVSGLRGGGFAISYSLTGAAKYQRYDSAGAKSGSSVEIFPSGNYFETDIAPLEFGGWAITFSRAGGFGDGTDSEVGCIGYDEFGVPLGAGLQMCNAPDSSIDSLPMISATSEGWVVCWVKSADVGLDGGDRDILMQRYTHAGVPVGGNVLVDEADVDQDDVTPVVSMTANGWVVVWVSERVPGANTGGNPGSLSELRYSRFDKNGVPLIQNAYLGQVTLQGASVGYGVSIATNGGGRWMHLINQKDFGVDLCLSWLEDEFSLDGIYLLGDGTTTVTARVEDEATNVAEAQTSFEGKFSQPELIGLSVDQTNVEGGEPIEFTLTFSEPVRYLAAEDIVGNLSTVTLYGEDTSSELSLEHDLTLFAQPNDQVAGGSFRPYLKPGSEIKDAYGNPIKADDILGDLITVSQDLTPPECLSITPLAPLITGERVGLIMEFSEPVSGVGSDDFLFGSIAGDTSEVRMEVYSGDGREVYGGYFEVGYDFLSGVGGTSGSFTVDILTTIARINDMAGNAMVVDFSSIPFTVSAAPYQEWAIGHGLTDWAPDANSDGDGLFDFQEFFHNMDPNDSSDRLIRRYATTTIDGKDYLTVTVPFRDGMEENFAISQSQTSAGMGRFAADVRGFIHNIFFQSSLDLNSFGSPVGFTILESPQDGPMAGRPDLPVLPAGYHYRTLRLNEAVEDHPGAFIRMGMQALQD